MSETKTNALVVVESPAKVRTLERYLGKGYKVKASVGHVIDLPKRSFGVDIEHDFTPKYEVLPDKKKIVADLKKAAENVDIIYLAPDPDREGEAIAWHIAQELDNGNRQYYRILINEITKRGIKEAFDNPSKLDEDKFNSQQTRRILDRIVGYKISPLLGKKVRRGLSAGRVQSVAVRIICEREREIMMFAPKEHWSITATLLGKNPPKFDAKVFKIGDEKVSQGKPIILWIFRFMQEPAFLLADEKLEPGRISSENEAGKIVEDLKAGQFIVEEATHKEVRRYPQPPFVTANLQQDAANKLGLTAKQTMALAQEMYAGMQLPGEGQVALITYMRTDSHRIAPEARKAARELISTKYGKDHIPDKPPVYKSKKAAQEAHEAIRPTDLSYTPEKIIKLLGKDKQRHAKLYDLIYRRFLASQMVPAILDQTIIDVKNEKHLLRATGSVVKFDGFLAVYPEAIENELVLPLLEENDHLKVLKIEPKQHFTQPPPRFTEASLVKELEDKGIGRPSTYAAIMGTIVDRGYTTKEKKRFAPTELGMITNDLLVESFPTILDIEFTAQMEDKLDLIEEGKLKWLEVLKEFYGPFAKALDLAYKNMRNIKQERIQHTDIPCEKCGAEMIIRWGRNGEFLACSAYPECKNTKNFIKEEDGTVKPVEAGAASEAAEKLDIECPECSKSLTVKRGRRGEFLGCTGYPACKFTSNFIKRDDDSIVVLHGFKEGDECPSCSKPLTPKKGRMGPFLGCSGYPDCKVVIPLRGRSSSGKGKSGDGASDSAPDENVKCDKCGSPMVRRSGRYGEFYGCSAYPKCRGITKIPKEK